MRSSWLVTGTSGDLSWRGVGLVSFWPLCLLRIEDGPVSCHFASEQEQKNAFRIPCNVGFRKGIGCFGRGLVPDRIDGWDTAMPQALLTGEAGSGSSIAYPSDTQKHCI